MAEVFDFGHANRVKVPQKLTTEVVTSAAQSSELARDSSGGISAQRDRSYDRRTKEPFDFKSLAAAVENFGHIPDLS